MQRIDRERLPEPLRSFFYQLQRAARWAVRGTNVAVEDALQQGLLICLQQLPRWESERASFSTFIYPHLRKLRTWAFQQSHALTHPPAAYYYSKFAQTEAGEHVLGFGRSLDVPKHLDHPGSTLADSVEQTVYPLPDAALEEFEHLDGVRKCVDSLNDRDAEIIRRRFGIGEVQEETLEEIGREQGCTREYVRQREERALKSLRCRLLAVV